MLGPALFGPCRYIAASSPLVATLDSLLRSSVIMKTRTWGSTFMYLPSSLSLANESWDLLISPSIFFFSVTNLDSRPRPRPSPSPASRLLFAPPAQAYTRCTAPSLPRVEKKGQEPSLACPRRPACLTSFPLITQTCLPHVPPSAATRRPAINPISCSDASFPLIPQTCRPGLPAARYP